MANCPNCGVHLKKTYWKPNCPNCNVNIFYHGMEERLEQDALKADASLDKMYRAFDRAKSSYVGAKRAIVRIVFSLLPVAALFLPLAKVSVSVPYLDKVENISIINVYNMISSLDFGKVFKIMGSDIVGTSTIFAVCAMLFIAIGAVAFLLHFILLFMSCGPKGHQRNISLAGIGLGGTVLSAVFFYLACSKFTDIVSSSFSGTFNWGFMILMVMTIAPLAIDLFILKHPVEVIDTTEKRKAEIAEKAAKMAAETAAREEAQRQQEMIEKAYLEAHPELAEEHHHHRKHKEEKEEAKK